MAKYIGETALAELVSKTKTLVATKQDTLTAGENITISGNTISASVTKNLTGNVIIRDLDAGIYKWTATNETHSVYYGGNNNSSNYFEVATGEFILLVSKQSLAVREWLLLANEANDTSALVNFYVGRNSITSGSYKRIDEKYVNVTTLGGKLYGTTKDSGGQVTQTAISYDNTATASTIVQRDSNAQVLVAETPTADGHATSKKYVDTQLGNKQDTLTFDTTPTSASTNPVTSGGVYTALNNKVDKVSGKGLSTNDFVSANYYTKTQIDGMVSAVYKPAGSIAFANLPTLSASVLGNVYNVTNAFITTSDFVEGSGKSYPAGTNVVVVDTSATSTPSYKFDVLAGMVDLSGYVPTSRTVNGKALSSNISLSASDVGALASNTTYVSSVNGSSGAITGIQTKANIVTSFGSTTSDSKYPSEKLVKTSLDAKQDTMTEITTAEIDALFNN